MEVILSNSLELNLNDINYKEFNNPSISIPQKYNLYTNIDPKCSIDILKKNLEFTKSKFDTFGLSNKKIERITSIYDPFKYEKHNLANKINGVNVTNAWLKCYEIICKYNIISTYDGIQIKDKLIHFDNASLPGSFILAIHHYIKTKIPSMEYEWKASSLIRDNDALDDSYNLYNNYPDNWIMDLDNNGDITNMSVINDILVKFNNPSSEKVDLYTSDLGFGISEDYNKQEIKHIRANTAQIFISLNIMKCGANCIIKHYTYFESYTQSYLFVFSKLFKHCYIYKPVSSKKLNSEVYIIGIGFMQSDSELQDKYLYKLNNILYKSLYHNSFNIFINPIILSKFILHILPMTTTIYNSQIACINKVISKIDDLVQYKYIKDHKLLKLNKICNIIKLDISDDIYNAICNYYKIIGNKKSLIKISPRDILNIKSIF